MDADNGRAFVLQPGQGRRIDLGGFRMAVKAAPEATCEAFSLLEAEEPPGFGPPLHVHHDAAEAFYVLEGEYIMFLGREEVVCPAGSFIYIPAGAPHGFRVGNMVSRKLNFYTPAAMVGYFDDLAEAIRKDQCRPGVPVQDRGQVLDGGARTGARRLRVDFSRPGLGSSCRGFAAQRPAPTPRQLPGCLDG